MIAVLSLRLKREDAIGVITAARTATAVPNGRFRLVR
jgi:hypothetical protein